MSKQLTFNQKLKYIGCRILHNDGLVNYKNINPLDIDIEETILQACYASETDLRLLSILATWMSVHGDYIIVEKFYKKLKVFETIYGHRPSTINLIAVQVLLSGSTKWKKWITSHSKKSEFPVNEKLLISSIDFQGYNEDFKKHGVKIPKNFLRIREDDVLTTSELVKLNLQFKNRLIFGSSWRADIMTAIEAGVENPSKIAKLIGCSYEPAHRVFNEMKIVSNL